MILQFFKKEKKNDITQHILKGFRIWDEEDIFLATVEELLIQNGLTTYQACNTPKMHYSFQAKFTCSDVWLTCGPEWRVNTH